MNEKSQKLKSNNKTKNNLVINGSFTRVKLSGSLLKLSSLYSIKKTWVLLLVITLISLISGFIGVLFLQNTGLYNVGFEAFAQGIARLVSFLIKGDPSLKNSVMNALFWSLIIVVNIPLIFFGWIKIGKKFTLFTTYYIVVSSLFGLFLGYIPGIEKVFLFSQVIPLKEFAQEGVQIAFWNSQHDSIVQISLFIYGLFYGLIQAICYATLFIIGTSSGGLDFIVVWYAEKKYKNLGTIFTYFNILCFLISYIMGTYVTSSIVLENNNNLIFDNVTQQKTEITKAWSADLFFSPNLMATLLMSIVLGVTLNAFFPKYQMSKVEILSKNVNEIRDYIIDQNKPYSLSLKTIEGGYSRLPQHMLVTVCMYVDAAHLLEIVRKYDPNALFTVTIVKSVDGYVYVANKEEEEFKLFSSLKRKKHKNNESEIVSDLEFEVDDTLLKDHKIDSPKKDSAGKTIKIIEASEVYDKSLDEHEHDDN